MKEMKKRIEGKTEAEESENVLTAPMSRRAFGKMLGAQTLLASAATAVTLSGCGGGDSDDEPAIVDGGTTTLTRAAFVATISDYFNWPHSSEYKDRFANAQPVFVDVAIGLTPYAKQIETALEENVVSNIDPYFRPEATVTREEAADMYVRAFMLPAASGNPLSGFTDANSIAKDKLASVKAMVSGGFMSGTSTTLFSPKSTLTVNEAKAILNKITTAVVAPVQVMPKPGTTSPRRFVSTMTPTPGATIYLTETEDGTEPADPSTCPVHPTFVFTPGSHPKITPLVPAGYSAPFDAWTMGVRMYKFPELPDQSQATVTQKLMRVKMVAKKDGMQMSGVREFVWNIYRARDSDFEAKLVHAPTSTSPAVYQIYNLCEAVQANAYYIEGSTGGIVFDFLQYSYPATSAGQRAGTMKAFIDGLATKPYIGILGHNHTDHKAQIGSFTDAGVTVYTSLQDKAQLINTVHNPVQFTQAATDSFIRAGNAVKTLTDGQVFDLGNCKVTAWQAPGHEHGLVTVVINETGWVYTSDMWGCNRPYTADTTNYSGVKTDLMLSLTQQLWTNYLKSSTTGQITELTNAHNDFPVGVEATMNFIKIFQNPIDNGAAGTRPSIRTAANSRMGWVHKGDLTNMWGMWRDKNWMAAELGGKYSATVLDSLTKPTTDYPCNAKIDYNGTDGYKKYSVLSNVEIGGGTLVGVDVYWAAPANGTDHKLPNKLDPWTYAYTINVPAANSSITFKPTAMSNKITSMKVNGTAIKQGDSVTVSVSAGTKIAVDIVAQDGVTTSSYTFTVAKV